MAAEHTSLEDYTRTRPVFTVDLDAGVFFWLKEIVDAKHKAMLDSRPQEYKDMVARAVLEFGEALGEKTAAIEAATTAPKPVRRIRRRDPEPPVRRGVKRRSAG